MAIDGIILDSVYKSLVPLLPFKIVKFQQISNEELIWVIRSNHENYRLFISLHSVYNRINFTNKSYPTQTPQNFVMVLRKQLEGGIITKIEQHSYDRVLHLEIQVRNSLGDMNNFHVYIELMGKYANMILVNAENKIIDAYKRIPPYENSKRIIHPGAIFSSPPVNSHKQDPFLISSIGIDTDLSTVLQGFSPLLAREVTFRISNGESFSAIMNLIKESTSLFASEVVDKYEMHLIPLSHLQIPFEEYELHSGFDVIYEKQENKLRIKQHIGDIFRHVDRELKRNVKKLGKLESSLAQALNHDHYRLYGDLLFSNLTIERHPIITLQDFISNDNINIPIDMRFDIKQNANNYYQKYHKAKRAIKILGEQINVCENEINYLENIKSQTALATINDALEIKNELEQNGYIRKSKNNKQTSRKKNVPNYISLCIKDVNYYIGKNNLQNAYVTWSKARKTDTWLHVSKMHGSHVVIASDNCTEEMLRNGAMLAAFFSEAQNSGSIPVDYTNIKQLKKIPNMKGSSVIMNTYKTIYIDIDTTHISNLLNQVVRN